LSLSNDNFNAFWLFHFFSEIKAYFTAKAKKKKKKPTQSDFSYTLAYPTLKYETS